MSKRTRIWVGGVLLAMMTANLGVAITSIFIPQSGSDEGIDARWDGRGEPYIDEVDPKGPAAGLLKPGDEIIAINGVKFWDQPEVLINSAPVPPGTRIRLTVRRQGTLVEAVIQTVPRKFEPRFDSDVLIITLFLLIAWMVFAFRPDDKQAWLLALLLATLTSRWGTRRRISLPGSVRLPETRGSWDLCFFRSWFIFS